MKGLLFTLSALLTVKLGFLMGIAPAVGHLNAMLDLKNDLTGNIPYSWETNLGPDLAPISVAAAQKPVADSLGRVMLEIDSMAKPDKQEASSVNASGSTTSEANPAQLVTSKSAYSKSCYFNKYGYQYHYEEEDFISRPDEEEIEAARSREIPEWVSHPIDGTIDAEAESQEESIRHEEDGYKDGEEQGVDEGDDAYQDGYQGQKETPVSTPLAQSANEPVRVQTANSPKEILDSYILDTLEFSDLLSGMKKGMSGDDLAATDEYGDEILVGPESAPYYCPPVPCYRPATTYEVTTELLEIKSGQPCPQEEESLETVPLPDKKKTGTPGLENRSPSTPKASNSKISDQKDRADENDHAWIDRFPSAGILELPEETRQLLEPYLLSEKRANGPLTPGKKTAFSPYSVRSTEVPADFYVDLLKTFPFEQEGWSDTRLFLPQEALSQIIGSPEEPSETKKPSDDSNDYVPCRYGDLDPQRLHYYEPRPAMAFTESSKKYLTSEDQQLLKRLDRMAIDPPAVRRAVLENHLEYLGPDAYFIRDRFERRTGTDLLSLAEDLPAAAVFLIVCRLTVNDTLLPAEAAALLQKSLAKLPTWWAKRIARSVDSVEEDSIDLVIDQVYREDYWEERWESEPVLQTKREPTPKG